MNFIEIDNINQIGEPNRFGIVNPSKAIRMMNRIVLDITYECDLGCMNCNRFCGIFPRKKELNIDKICHFINSSIKLNKKWSHIYIAGGEPSLHSSIDDIFKQINRYIEFHKNKFETSLIVKYFTNNHSDQARLKLQHIPDYIVINSNKKDSNSNFKPICVAPIDLGYYDDNNLQPCQELYQCGMTLNHEGFYPCAEAAAIDDVFLKKNLAVKCLEDVTFERMAAILHETCRYCGHYFEGLGYRRSSQLMVSSTWKKYLKEMKVLNEKECAGFDNDFL
jgi:hypothetical protein